MENQVVFFAIICYIVFGYLKNKTGDVMIINESIALGNCTPKAICLYKATVIPPAKHNCCKGNKMFDRFFYVISGEINIFNNNGTSLNAHAGTLIYLPGDVQYFSYWSEQEEGQYITLQFMLKDDDNNHLPLAGSSVIAARDKNGELYSLFIKAYDEYIQHGEFVGVRLKQLFFEIFYKILKQISRAEYKEKKYSAEIYKALIYINDNFMSEVEVEKLAQMCGLSITTFRRLFKLQTGTSPIKYKNRLKLLHAQDMLRSGLYNVSEVSTLLGCCDTAYFNKIYRQEFGVNPSEELKTY